MVDDFGINRMARAASMVPHPGLPYMTINERNVMLDLVAVGQLSIFRLKKCEHKPCGNDVVNNKQWCSKQCWQKGTNTQQETNNDDDDGEEG